MGKIRTLFFSLMIAAFVLCCNRATDIPRGVPDPPFEGELPIDKYVFEGESGIYGGALALALPGDPDTFNIIVSTGGHAHTALLNHVFRFLVDYRNGDNPPRYDAGLCWKWESTADAKEWTFILRRGIRWSDGEPFTADDVVFTYDVILKEPECALKDAFIEGRDAEGNPLYPGVEKIDDHTVRFKLNRSNAAFLDNISNLWLVPKHKWEKAFLEGRFAQVMKTSDDPKDVVTLGPYRIKEYVTGERLVLERNPYFWKVDKRGQRLPYLDRIVFVILKDFTTIQAKFQAGEIDGMWRVRPDDFALIKRMEGSAIKVVETGVSLEPYWMAINQNNSTNPRTGKLYVEPWKQRLFRNQKFRQAVSYAINRGGIANTVFSGRAVPIYSFVTPGEKVNYSDGIMKYEYDPGTAKSMLAEIGLKDANGDGFLEDGEGHTVEMVINTNSENSQRIGTANFIAQNLQEVGIKSRTDPRAFSVIRGMMENSFDFDAIVLGWQTGVPPGLINTKNILLSSGYSHVCFPLQKIPSTEWEAQIDRMVHQMEESADISEFSRLYAELQRIWSEQLPEINLVACLEAVAFKSKLRNIQPSLMPPQLTWNVEEIYIREK